MTESRWRRGLRSWRVRGLILAAVVALAPAMLFADVTYNDVPEGHVFHEPIFAITGAGITSGCGPNNPGGFCPSDNISRQAEAAFLHRGLSRTTLSFDFNEEILPSDDIPTDTLVGEVAVEVGGTTAKDPDAHQYVKVDAHVNFGYLTGDAPYPVQFYLAELVGTPVPVNQSLMIAPVMTSDTDIPAVVTVSWVFAASPGDHTYQLYAYTIEEDPDEPTALVQALTMTATTHTFGELPVQPLSSKPLPR